MKHDRPKGLAPKNLKAAFTALDYHYSLNK